jgi:hypothetical protein
MSSSYPRSFDRSGPDEVVDLAPMVAVAARVADAVPAGSPESWRRITFRAVLAAIIRDRVDNHTGDLEDGDVSSLDEFVEGAAAAAGKAPELYRDDAYEVLLHALLEDWVDNWESADDDDDDDD